MEINDLEFYLVEIGRNEPGRPVRSLLVRLLTDEGLEGWGESSLAWRAAELAPRRDALLPVLAGRSIFDIEELHVLEALANPQLRAAVEMAFWDLAGRAAGQPLCRLLGGEYRRRIPVAVRLADGTPRRMARVARTLAEHGFHAQIVASGGRIEDDVAALAAVREALGDRAELRLDAMARFDVETARDLCAALEYAGVRFVLDPLGTRELYPVASLGRQTGVPLAVGRAIGGPADVLALVRCGAARFVVVDPEQVGGIVPARKCAAVAEAGGVAAVLRGGPSLGIATAAMLHLAAATPAFENCNECAVDQLHDDVLAEPLEIGDGMIAVPQGPGLGVQLDRAKMERYQVT